MPKATVNQDRKPVFRQYKVRLARQITTMQTIAEASSVQVAADCELRAGILALDRRHHPRPGLGVDDIGQGNYLSTAIGDRLGAPALA